MTKVTDFYKTNGSVNVVYSGGPTLCRQEFADECDINQIMKRYENSGPNNLGPHPDVVPMYVDWSEMPDSLLSFMSRMDEAQVAFMTLPATVRKEFDNSAISFVDFASDPNNLDQMRTWGLAPPGKAAEAVVPPVGAPEPAPVAPPAGAS